MSSPPEQRQLGQEFLNKSESTLAGNRRTDLRATTGAGIAALTLIATLAWLPVEVATADASPERGRGAWLALEFLRFEHALVKKTSVRWSCKTRSSDLTFPDAFNEAVQELSLAMWSWAARSHPEVSADEREMEGAHDFLMGSVFTYMGEADAEADCPGLKD